MAFKITEECVSCGACESECPNEAISEGDEFYVIDAAKCCECVGFFDEPQCAAVCPTEAPVADEDNAESAEELIAKAKKLHPDKDFGDNYPSHLKG